MNWGGVLRTSIGCAILIMLHYTLRPLLGWRAPIDFMLIAGLFGRAATRDGHVYFDRAIVLTLFLQFPIGTVHIGELGFCAWTFLGLGLASRLAIGEHA